MLVSAAKTALMAYGFDASDPLLTWLDQGKNEVEEYFDWPFLQVIALVNAVTGANTLVLPADLFKIQSLRDVTNKNKLDYMEIDGFEREISDPTSTGKASIYTVTALSTIQLWPVLDSNATFRVVYQMNLSDHGADGVACPGPARLHYLYVLGAAYIALQADNEEDRSSNAQQAFRDSLARLKRKYAKPLGSAATVQNSAGY